MIYKNIIKKTTSNIGYIIINRPKNLNALNKETIIELNHLIQDFDSDKNIRSIIITGAEKKAFIAGADIKEFMFFDQENGQELAKNGQALLFDLIENLSKPCIAAINGFALGGGLELAMSCHIRVASINSKMGLPEVSLGVIPGYGGTQRLSQLVGKGKALEMIISGSMISSDDALKWGLVNYVCPQDELIEKCEYIANKISSNSPQAIAKAIKSINSSYSKDGFKTEIELFGSCFGTEEFKEGTNAFIEKRKPDY
tara:strand:+ start:560 stop:1327 length:768 start_codon:yes stop_codon:yes gene_type:complete